MVFQDPFSSINPVFRVSHGVTRALKLHRRDLSAAQRRAEAERVFEVVGLPADKLNAYPHELSGGQRQRVGFAQALAARPRLIDIASARYVADRIIVMYAGQVAECGPIEDILASPSHPYTQLLVSAVPDPKAPLANVIDKGEPPKVIDPAPGCRFQPRCPVAIDMCATVTPALLPLAGQAREVACHVAQAAAAAAAGPAGATASTTAEASSAATGSGTSAETLS
jgi:peptide/nickel transport system ATP-binding protein